MQHRPRGEPDMVMLLVPNFNRAMFGSLAAALPLIARPAHQPGKLVNRVIEVARHIINVSLGPAQARHPLPAAHLKFQSVPVTRLPV